MVKINQNLSVFLDFSRAFAAFLVVLSHIYLIIFQHVKGEDFFKSILKFLGAFGEQAVVVFFVLSGFLVSKSAVKALHEYDLKKYFLKRITRLHIVLIPSLIMTFIIGVYLIKYFSDYIDISLIERRTSILIFLGNMFFLQDILVPRFGLNGPLWSLANEFWYYVLFPIILIIFFKKYSFNKRFLALIILIFLTMLFLFFNFNIIKLFPLWLIGAGVWYIKKPIIKKPIIAIILFLIVFVSSYFDFFHRSGIGFIDNILIAITFALVINSLFFVDKTPNSLYKKLSHFFADFSYSLYLLHFPLLILINAVLLKFFQLNSFSFIELFLVFIFTIFLVYLYAYLIYLFTEKHTHKIQKFLIDKLDTKKEKFYSPFLFIITFIVLNIVLISSFNDQFLK